ncbi:MAG: ABC transporter substrate-binding protein [Eubacteriales bacterium]
MKKMSVLVSYVMLMCMVFLAGCTSQAASTEATSESAEVVAATEEVETTEEVEATEEAVEVAEVALPDKIVIGTQSMPNDEGIAKAEGYFEEELGSAVEIVSFDSGADVITAIAAGSIDFALAGSCPATIAISNGYEVECIWVHDVLGSAESLVVRAETGVEEVADLAGMVIATPFASTAHFSVLKALETAGLSVSDVTLLDMQPDEIYAAWENDLIDATYVWDPVLSQLSDATWLCTSGDLAEAGFMTSNVELVNSEFADLYPTVVEGYIKALDKAVALYQTDKESAVAVIAGALEIEADSAVSQMDGSIWLSAEEQLQESYFGTTDAKGALVENFYDTAEFLKEQDSIQEVPDYSVIEAAINPEFIEAVAAQK